MASHTLASGTLNAVTPPIFIPPKGRLAYAIQTPPGTPGAISLEWIPGGLEENQEVAADDDTRWTESEVYDAANDFPVTKVTEAGGWWHVKVKTAFTGSPGNFTVIMAIVEAA